MEIYVADDDKYCKAATQTNQIFFVTALIKRTRNGYLCLTLVLSLILLVNISSSSILNFNKPTTIHMKKSKSSRIDEGHHESGGCGVNLGKPGFDHINAPLWKQYNNQQAGYMKEVEACVLKLEMWKGHWSMIGPLQSINTTLGMFDCEEDFMDIQSSLRKWAKQYRRIWFFGDSIIGQQFDVLQCMLDPQATSNQTELSRYFVYNHTSNKVNRTKIIEAGEPEQNTLYMSRNSERFLHNETYPSTTAFERIFNGYLFDEKETPLYVTAFPTIIKYATNEDAIVVSAGAHYNHRRMDLMEKALRHVEKESRRTEASIFFIEPTPENWKTSNGMYGGWPRGFKYEDGCHQLSKARINGTDNTEGVHKNQPLSELNNSSMKVYERIYPEIMQVMNNSELSEVAAKASWRCDLARSIFGGENSISGKVKVKLIPIFWQLALSDISSNVHEGDCTHRSLTAIVNVNIQMMRHMNIAKNNNL